MSDRHRSAGPRGLPQQQMVPKIKEALNFMRNHSFEVPYIANYRREYVEPELDIHDLWKIYQWDEKVERERERESLLEDKSFKVVSTTYIVLKYSFQDTLHAPSFSPPSHTLTPSQWMQLKTRKQDMRRLFERMRDYQFEKVKEEPDKALTEDTRVLTDEDIMRYVHETSKQGCI